jgi:Phytanoyl-CoA dioxygenase (PhyH)
MGSTTTSARPRTGAFLRDGYAVLKRLLRADEVVALRADVERLLLAPARPSCERPHNTLVPLRWNDSSVVRVLASESRRSRLKEIVEAEDLRWISGYLSLKEPRSPALWWHQDWWCWDHPVSYRRQAPQVALLCYLDPTDDRNGALRVLPGSHHRSTSLHAVLPEADADDTRELAPTHPAVSDHPSQVTPELGAGDAVVIDYRLLHGTHPNATDARRDCLLLGFTPSWRALPADIRRHLIRHPALPADSERRPVASWARQLLPRYDGPRRDLPLSRVAPEDLAIVG